MYYPHTDPPFESGLCLFRSLVRRRWLVKEVVAPLLPLSLRGMRVGPLKSQIGKTLLLFLRHMYTIKEKIGISSHASFGFILCIYFMAYFCIVWPFLDFVNLATLLFSAVLFLQSKQFLLSFLSSFSYCIALPRAHPAAARLALRRPVDIGLTPVRSREHP